jgi:uncharacterized protein (DUF2141 family)
VKTAISYIAKDSIPKDSIPKDSILKDSVFPYPQPVWSNSVQQPSSHSSTLTRHLRLGVLTIELVALRNRRGVVNVALFDSPDGYPSNAELAVRCGKFSITDVPLIIQFEDLPYGEYAATLHHDENGDSKLTCNALGIPKEGIGFSGNPKIWKGIPPFHRSAFQFTPDAKEISITMKYLLP